jgi:hypothetical protein
VPTRSEAQSITAELDKGAANVQSEDEDDLFETPRGSNEELNLQLQDARRNRTFRGSVDGLIGDVAEEHDITKGSEAEIFDSPGSKTIVHSTPVTTDKTARTLEPRPGVSTVKQRLFQPPIADLRPPPWQVKLIPTRLPSIWQKDIVKTNLMSLIRGSIPWIMSRRSSWT